MSQSSSNIRRLLALTAVALTGFSLASIASAQAIQVKLNVIYENPLDTASGGEWELVAKTSEGNFGINLLDVYLTNIVTPPSQPIGPRGTVNSSDPAGFSLFLAVHPFNLPANVTEITIGQVAVIDPQTEQSIFYGVGRLPDGEPGDVGPQFTTLTNVQAVPWGSGDFFSAATWETAVLLAQGTFLPGLTPNFFSGSGVSTEGSVFTSLPPTAMTVGTLSSLAAASTFIQSNFGASPDYNGDGRVDAGDYVLWRNTLGNMAGEDLRADGNANGEIDLGDYAVWKANYGLIIPPGPGGGGLAGAVLVGPGSGSVVPEPASVLLLAGAGAVLLLRPKRRVLRHVNLL